MTVEAPAQSSKVQYLERQIEHLNYEIARLKGDLCLAKKRAHVLEERLRQTETRC